ncbi:Ig-like domain-containing protein [Flagellimonas okinawensis]|uniref:Gliding motility-associated C-terminal domain-containing protein n=1 Tax=Flagellimonas okinawensis TaxID=3031324 RepID=A0ABT5XQS5_9FLAO|nr:gliding motility-associated C-terminal domain-containing protein [[Muricauda] okinawensis]MDF0708241.1 gliding motility-associated C-terminal domain-containing protein [[Muricauda] okinawensis]
MENFTFVRLKQRLVQKSTLLVLIFIVGLKSAFGANTYNTSHTLPSGDHHAENKYDVQSVGWANNLWNPLAQEFSTVDCDGDGVTCEQENLDGTDPNDPCDFILSHQNCAPSQEWKNADCDGDGVSNEKEKEDSTDPLDPCDLVLEHQNCAPSQEWKNADCDGDGVSNGKEKEDGTDPFDPCDLILEHQNCAPSQEWKNADCDGDGVSNGQEKEDGTDPLDPCDFILEHQDCAPTQEWKNADCDGDGVSNGQEKEDDTDPLDPCDFILEHQDCAPTQEWKNADCDGDGVSNGQEKEDDTDPLDPCDFILEHQDCTPTQEWKETDCDGDGVTNEDEKEDGTDPLDPCDYNPESITLPRSGDYLEVDCDGDGVNNGDEEEDGTDPQDPCDFNLESQTMDPSSTWNTSDCDGDGVTNEDEKEDGTDPLDPCDYNPESVTLPQSADWEALDCDGDGNPNGNDPDPLMANASDDFGSTAALTEVAINILENDDFLANNDPNQLGVTNLTRIGGDATGEVTFNNETGFVGYTPLVTESNSTVTIIYQVCNVLPDPSVCASATIYIEVGANNLDAVDDSFTVESGEDGMIPDSNVLSNDTYNDGAATLDNINLSSTPTDELMINFDGSVSVVPGTGPGTYTIDYTICDLTDATNCDTATVTVEVMEGAGNVLDAVDDSYTVESGEDGMIPDSNVLSNDTYNDGAATLDNVNLSSTSTDELIINPDGSVSVVPGTGPGTYTIDYTICDLTDTTNCDTATVTVEVMEGAGNVLDAVDDSYTVESGEDGMIPDSNVLSNDTYNDGGATFDNVNLSSTSTDELIINPDGSVSVVPGTGPGTYTIDYTICDLADATNCDTATVTVEVMEGAGNGLDAVDDSFSVGSGEDGMIPDSNVLSNDTYNDGEVTLDNVILSSTPTDELIINPDGSVSVIPGTGPGTYTIDYTLCDVMDVNNCDTATVTVEVMEGAGNVLDAVDDSYTVESGDDGMIPDSNVLSNDTYNDGAATLDNVNLSSTPTDELIINPDGSVSVVPGTGPGTYTIDYTICDLTDTTNCDTATVTVEVVSGMDNEIDAVDDGYNTGSGGGLITDSNVLLNDTLNDEQVSPIDVILTSTSTNELSINDNGEVILASNTPAGTYTIEYTICEAANPDNCDTATVTVIVEDIEVNQMLTPNGDLKNDFLFIRGVEYIKSSTIKIFNRWGTLVFEGNNYDNVNNVFDGRVRGKSALSVNDYLPAGVYFYIFNYQTEQGSFTDSEYLYISR